ncbi:hypothetical protein [Dietzia sp. IN118]|uniref:hypothetical protein n=1 Tax=Dietzia sp. IN118 TaxID=3061631 RepID=UPI00293A1600|nr:hypothetical protein [Dietzia sp. IN118]MDV3354470.1 hypothetical protein [Dietzia sp. IN118]
MTTKSNLLVACGYYDQFSGYQEIGITRALARRANVTVVAGDRVNPIFSDAHLGNIGASRTYSTEVTIDQNVEVRRFKAHEMRSMLVSPSAIGYMRKGRWDGIVQIMPGQLLPAAPAFICHGQPRAVLYGDNDAMYANLSKSAARAKRAIFNATKGQVYRAVNREATSVFGYTQNTCKIIDRLNSGPDCSLLPIAFDNEIFFYDEDLRRTTRGHLGFDENDVVIFAPGKPQKQKQFIELLRIFAAIAPGTNAKLMFAGAGSDQASDELRQAVKVNNLHQRVVIQPFVDSRTLNSLFNASDIGVWPAMPAATIQQSMGTGLRTIFPENDLVGHLAYSQAQCVTFAEGLSKFATTLKSSIEANRAGVSRSALSQGSQWLSTDSIADRVLTGLGLN